MGKSRFRTFDAFQKTVEEARIRTASGGLVTLVSACIIISLLILEIWDWRRIIIRNELIVDNTRGAPRNPLGTLTDCRRETRHTSEYDVSSFALC